MLPECPGGRQRKIIDQRSETREIILELRRRERRGREMRQAVFTGRDIHAGRDVRALPQKIAAMRTALVPPPRYCGVIRGE